MVLRNSQYLIFCCVDGKIEIHGMNCDGDRNEAVEIVNAVECSRRPRTMLLWLMVIRRWWSYVANSTDVISVINSWNRIALI